MIVWTVLLFALGVPLPVIIIACLLVGACDKEPKPPVVNVNVPVPRPVQSQPTLASSDGWVQHALRNPEVTLQVVEKYEVQNGQFTAEKHMRMTGPVEAAPGQRRVICIMPSGRKPKWRNNVGQM
jgi:hypothetical protein